MRSALFSEFCEARRSWAPVRLPGFRVRRRGQRPRAGLLEDQAGLRFPQRVILPNLVERGENHASAIPPEGTSVGEKRREGLQTHGCRVGRPGYT